MTYQIHQSQDGSILIGNRAGLSNISIEITGVGQKLALPVDGSISNAEAIHWLRKGSLLSFDVEDNEGNVEPQVSSWGFTPPSATAALGQDEGSASHRPTEDARGNARITLLIDDYTFPMTMEKSEHRPGAKTPGWYAYYRPKREEEDDEE